MHDEMHDTDPLDLDSVHKPPIQMDVWKTVEFRWRLTKSGKLVCREKGELATPAPQDFLIY